MSEWQRPHQEAEKDDKEEKATMIWVVVKIMVPFLDPYYNTAPNIQGTQKGTRVLTTAWAQIQTRGTPKLLGFRV